MGDWLWSLWAAAKADRVRNAVVKIILLSVDYGCLLWLAGDEWYL